MQRGWGILILSLGLSLLAAACSSSPPPKNLPQARFEKPALSDEELVWQRATLGVPLRGTAGSMITTNDAGLALQKLAGARQGTRWPVIIIVEGCRDETPPRLIRALAEQGYVALVLSSRARRHLPLACQPGATLEANARAILIQKQAELTFARGALVGAGWADLQNIFVFGNFEAGAAVARSAGALAKARILTGWSCEGPGTGGLRDSALSPVFSVAIAPSLNPSGTGCAAHMNDNPYNKYLHLTQPYSLNVLLEPIVFTQLLQFLDQQLFK
jgi:hypothetical protein